ncbi:MAG: hypothetical protein EHM45_01540 [Desulfobacteraceae bacterium]|nr:MAG: hypothetical protein EHM45_01540 [Desulfobacteraceae bacterium]
MRRLTFLVSVIFIALLLPGIVVGAPPKAVQRIEIPKVVPKKLTADLYVKSVKLDPSLPRVGKDMIQIKVTIGNAGAAAPSKACSWAMLVKNISTHPEHSHQVIPWYANNIPRLAPGATVEINNTITIPYTGMYHLSGVIITEGLEVGEEKSENNHYVLPFQVVDAPAKSDLVLDALTPTDDGRIKIKMHNQGARIPDVDFNKSYVRVTVNDTIEKSIHFTEIDPNGLLKPGETPAGSGINRVYLSYIWPATDPKGIKLEPGHTYKVKVVLDYNNRISDMDGSNNMKTVVWGMTP